MLIFHSYPNISVTIETRKQTFDDKLQKEVNSIWDKKNKEKANSLFNGQILSIRRIKGSQIFTYPAEYKYFLAQQATPKLYQDLKIRPLAVSGVLECPQGFIFGLRHGTTQDDHKWELVPSGSIEAKEIKPTDSIHHEQIIGELYEEIGLSLDDLSKITTFGLLEDTQSHVVDVGIHLQTKLTFNKIKKIFQNNNCQEYADILVVDRNDIPEFTTKLNVVPASKLFINQLII